MRYNNKIIKNGKITTNVQIKQPFGNITRFNTDKTVINCAFSISRPNQKSELYYVKHEK